MSESTHPSVLVVDDDSSGRAMLGLSLRQAGFFVGTAAGGQEALNRLKEKPYDWLITDARMFPMDGFTLIREAKRIQPNIHIIMMSAICTERDANGYPIEGFFCKPVAVDQLMSCISANSP